MLKWFKTKVKDHEFPLYIDFLKWFLIDLYRAIRYNTKKHLYGLIVVCGRTGSGKTTFATAYAIKMRKYYGDSIYIASNFYLDDSIQDFSIDHWQDLVKVYNKPCLFLLDEANSLFNSKEYKSFPPDLITIITQNRKKDEEIFSKQIVAITQDWTALDISFRRYSIAVVQIKSFFTRLILGSWYTPEMYQQKYEQVNVDKAMKIKPFKTDRFIASDKLRSFYDSFKFVKTMLNKEYITREEMAKFYSRDGNLHNFIKVELKK